MPDGPLRSSMRPPATDDRPSTRKTLLFCPDCEHRSHVDGDWCVAETLAGTEYECPDCGTVIQVRPSLDADHDGSVFRTLVRVPVATLRRTLPLVGLF